MKNIAMMAGLLIRFNDN